jgi:hypothetical protein
MVNYKSFTGAGLPIYKGGSLKGFQLTNNFGNYSIDLIQVNDFVFPAFITQFAALSSGSYIVSAYVYELDRSKLDMAYTYTDLVAARGSYYTLNTSNIAKETKLNLYQRFYSNGFNLSTVLAAGIYELVITDSDGNIYESEIFSNCLHKNTDFGITCSNATCPNIQTGTNAVFSITINENNGVSIDDLTMTVEWNIINNTKYDDYVHPYIYENAALNLIQTLDFDLAANEDKVLTFTYPTILPTGSYSVSYKLSVGSVCVGTINFTVGNSCITFISGVWS